jgi:hypothetical protein
MVVPVDVFAAANSSPSGAAATRRGRFGGSGSEPCGSGMVNRVGGMHVLGCVTAFLKGGDLRDLEHDA